MIHRAAQLRALKAREQLPIEIRYTKPDPRPSIEMAGAAAFTPSAPAEAPSATWPLVVLAAATVVFGLGGATAFRAEIARRRRAAALPYERSDATDGDRFCANCGAALG